MESPVLIGPPTSQQEVSVIQSFSQNSKSTEVCKNNVSLIGQAIARYLFPDPHLMNRALLYDLCCGGLVILGLIPKYYLSEYLLKRLIQMSCVFCMRLRQTVAVRKIDNFLSPLKCNFQICNCRVKHSVSECKVDRDRYST